MKYTNSLNDLKISAIAILSDWRFKAKFTEDRELTQHNFLGFVYGCGRFCEDGEIDMPVEQDDENLQEVFHFAKDQELFTTKTVYKYTCPSCGEEHLDESGSGMRICSESKCDTMITGMPHIDLYQINV